jgi:tetratricopeptide (TPR) repeat protein
VASDRDEAHKQAEKLVKLGRLDQALAEYERVLAESPDDWKTVTAAADLYLRANQPARAAALFNRQADHLAAQGFLPRAEAFYKRVLKFEPLNEHALDRLASIAIKSGIAAEARAHLTALARVRQARGDESGAAAANLQIGQLEPADFAARREAARAAASTGNADFAAVELPKSAGDVDAAERGDEAAVKEGVREPARSARDWAALAAAHERAGNLPQALAAVQEGLKVGPDNAELHRIALSSPALEWPVAEHQADAALEAGEGEAAAARLKQFVARHPGHVLALVKLIEVAVDAGLEAERTAAQDALCGAYLAAGQGAEARIIAEDLLARAPDDARFRERLRQALALTGATSVGEAPAADAAFRLAHGAIDLGAVLGDDQVGRAETQAGGAVAPEVDLSAVIDGLRPHTLAASAAQKGSSMPDRPDPSNLDDVFRDFRDEVSRQNAVDQAEQHYKVALTYRDMGMIDDAVRELEVAAKSPRLRFDAAALLARLLRDRGEVASAVEWFERAAEAPAPTPEAGRQLLYELGQALEESSETSRALAVYLELQADARDYRDVTARVDRLSRVQTES